MGEAMKTVTKVEGARSVCLTTTVRGKRVQLAHARGEQRLELHVDDGTGLFMFAGYVDSLADEALRGELIAAWNLEDVIANGDRADFADEYAADAAREVA